MNKIGQISSIAILGGSFNPLHFGHLRLSVEVCEELGPSRFDFVPCAKPPHKRQSDLLPFELRYAMLRAATKDNPRYFVNDLEAGREGLSFTADTLAEYRHQYPEAKLYFVLGAEDFAQLDTWKDWQSLPALAELVIVARQGAEGSDFLDIVKRLWPHAAHSCELLGRPSCKIGESAHVSYLSLPRLDISASLIRERWLAGRSIDYWVTREVIDFLHKNAEAIKKHWLA